MDKECARVKKSEYKYKSSRQLAGLDDDLLNEIQTVRYENFPIKNENDWKCLDVLKKQPSNNNILTPAQYEGLSMGTLGMSVSEKLGDSYNDYFIAQLGT